MTFQELITTLADKGDFDTSIGSYAWRAVEAWLNANKEAVDNDNQMRLLVEIAANTAKRESAEYPTFQILIPTR